MQFLRTEGHGRQLPWSHFKRFEDEAVTARLLFGLRAITLLLSRDLISLELHFFKPESLEQAGQGCARIPLRRFQNSIQQRRLI